MRGRGEPFEVVLIAGTRPEAIKLAPVAIELAKRSGISQSIWASGQQGALFDDAIANLSVKVDCRIITIVGNGSNDDRVNRLRNAISSALEKARPDLILVQGDTNTALAAAQAAHTLGITVGHVEAGLRTHIACRPYPEEENRVRIGQLATLHFAPSMLAKDNLVAEGISANVHVTGNTGIDAMIAAPMRPAASSHQPQILVTCHRRENFGAPLGAICGAIGALAQAGAAITLPVHSNPAVATPIRAALTDEPNVRLVEPLPYPEMLAAIRASMFVLSDSGGLQEECAALGTPLLLMRYETERPEVVAGGNCILVGSDSGAIMRESRRLLTDPAHFASMSRPFWPYGDGTAAPRIVDAIEAWAGL